MILKHEGGAASFIYHDSVIFDDAAVAFTKFGIRPGQVNVRTHFEKVMRSPIVGESDAAPPGPSSQSSDPEHAKRKRADDSDAPPPAAPPGFVSPWACPGNRKRSQSTSTAAAPPKVARKSEDVLADLLDGGKPDRVSEDEEDLGAESESEKPDEDSDDDEFFDMQMALRSSLSPAYLNTPRMQWIMATEELSEQLRAEPLLCLLYTSPSPRDQRGSRMPSSA